MDESGHSTTVEVCQHRYTKLSDATRDIRLLTILPGQFTDPIKLGLRHIGLDDSNEDDKRTSIAEVKKTLPLDWEVREAFGGRFLFCKNNEGVWVTTWEHPCTETPNHEHVASHNDNSQEHESYEALSYTWGSQDNPATALIEQACNNSSEPRLQFSQIPIRRNLDSALRHLRLHDKPRTLWVDAVCINQNDEAERNEQVRRMESIFTKASRVIIWLGEEANNSTRAMSVLEYIGKQLVMCDNSTSFFPSPNNSEPDWYDRLSSELPYDDEDWESVTYLLHRPWFSRRWVVQEAQLSNSCSIVQCGHDQMAWTDFCSVCAYLTWKVVLLATVREAAGSVWQLSFNPRSKSFVSHLARFYGKECADDRDRVYAMLGIASEQLRRGLHPQYSLSVAEVYRDTFLAEAIWSHRLEFLLLCSLKNRRVDLPTWIPDLAAPRVTPTSLQCQFSCGFAAAVMEHKDPGILIVKGVQCAVVGDVSSPCPADMELIWQFWLDWSVTDGMEAHMRSGDSALETIIRTICPDVIDDRIVDVSSPNLQQWKLHLIRRDPLLGFFANLRWSPKDLAPVPHMIMEKARGNLIGRSFFLGENGMIGLCPAESLPGDIVSVLLGFDAPVMLRPTLNNTYQVVGQCSVAALQDSTSLLGPLPSSWKVRFLWQEGQNRPYYVQKSTGTRTFADPRLPPLNRWQCLDAMPLDVTCESAAVFQNMDSGETIHSDPRITPEALEQRGVNLVSFHLV